MWLKKMLGKPPPPPVSYPSKPNENKSEFDNENQEVDGQGQSVLIDQTPQTRYQNLSIIEHTSVLKVPSIVVHSSESIFIEEANLIMAKNINEGQWRQIDLLVSDRQLILTPNILQQMGRSTLNYFTLSFSHIEKCEVSSNKKEQTKLHLTLKDNRQFQLKCVIGDIIVKIHEIIKKFAFPNGINKFYAFRYFRFNKEKQQMFEGWKSYNIQKQFSRQGIGIDDGSKFLYKWVQNKSGQISHTYPQRLVIPAKMSIENLKKCAAFRTKQRFPTLTFAYQYKPNRFSTIFRCSQNKVGMLNSRSKQDEEMMIYIGDPLSDSQQAISKPNCKIYDARGYYAALGNMFAGKGYQKSQNYKNCEIQWLNIPNIHAVRDSYNQMFMQKDTNSNYFLNISNSGWYQYLSLILAGSKSISQDLINGINVVVHCSDGWDRTSQLCALGQMLLDPFYRTLEGLIVLIEKDWRHFGHKFRQRTGQFRPVNYHPHERSQIFIQFLDCIYQLMNQFPLSFQYNQRLLLFLAENVDSNVYGTFMTNNIQEAKQLKMQHQTISIWSSVKQNRQIYKNPFYKSELKQFWLNVGTEPKHMKVWRQFFFGDGTTENTAYHMMRQSIQINKTMRSQYYSNQQLIEKLKEQLKELSK